jgi:hypothetical protein
MVLIYSPVISPRLTYTAKQLFGVLLKAEYKLTNNRDAFLTANDARINYSDERIESSITILPNGLLNESTVTKITPTIGEWENTPILFATENDKAPFDIFSAVFYLLSRYEEYTDSARDKHGRFTAKQSFLYKNNLLHLPLINIWANKLRLILNKSYELNISRLEHQYISTIDIDHVFYYKYKPLLKNILGGVKQLLKGDFENLNLRIKTVLGGKDPNDIYDWLLTEHEKHHTKAIFFFLIGEKHLPYDPPPIFDKKDVAEVIRLIADKNSIGIHPSYHSLNRKTLVLKEKQCLEELTGQKISVSRQHYLRFSLPETYRVLAKCGIENEYSMGYADHVGYRAGTATPFTWFDLEKNEETNLMVHPFAVMDVSLKNYMQQTPEQAIETIQKLNAPLQENGGTFTSLWHNESLSNKGEWKNWRKVYQLLLTFNP